MIASAARREHMPVPLMNLLRRGPSLAPHRNSATCRPVCGCCCIAPSISALGKPAGERCRHLTEDLRCAIFGRPERPAVCSGLRPGPEMCGTTREEAMAYLERLERITLPTIK